MNPTVRTARPGDGLVPLDSVLCTEELNRRPSRPPDYETENRALSALAQALADSPHTILQTLVDTILEVFQADSAGLSLVTKDGKRFYWPAIAGAWKRHVGGGTPRDFGPCGDVLDCNAPMLFKHFERRYPHLLAVTPAAKEALLLPFHVHGRAVGTIWAMAHNDRRRFDAEDLRQLESLGRFASAAYQAMELQQAKDSRRAALNLMEDAVLARRAIEKLNVELGEAEATGRRLVAELEAIYGTSPVGMLQLDSQLRYVRINEVLAKMNGLPAAKHLGRTVREVVPGLADQVEPAFRRILETGEPVVDIELTGETAAEPGVQRTWLESWYPLRNGEGRIVGLNVQAQEITERKRAAALIRCQKQSLEMLVNGEPLEQILEFLARSMEGQSQGGFVVAIHLLEADGYHFGYVAAPSLPASYAQATKGLDARLQLGPCSSAVVSHEPTVVRDFAAEARWPAFSAEAVSLGLRGGFSTPILSPDRSVLGTFAIYYREPRDPSPNDRQLVDIVTHTVAIAIERKQAEQALREADERLRFIMDSAPQKIFTAKPNGDVDYFNPIWSEFTGLSFERIRDWGWTQFIHPDDAAENKRVWQHSIDTGEPFQFEHRFRRADGEYRWHLSRALPQRDDEGNILLWVGSNTDIHEQRQTTDQLRQYAADLSESDRRKNEFLALLAHELRNPLAPIRNAVQVLRLTGGNGEAVQTASEMMERQLGQMVRLVDDLLDASRISLGKIELRRGRIELASAVNHAVEAIRPQYKSMEHDLTVTLPPEPIYLNADPTRLAQVVGNLMNNACKFTDKGGHIWLTVEREGEQAIIRVRDSGIGIAADQLPHIFEMFMQVDTSLEHSANGLGIGLTLVKNLVEMHGGVLEVHSEGLGQGSEFVVRLPISVETAEPAPPEPAITERTPTTARRILVVDDNRDSATSLAMLLKLTGNETHTAYDGLEAVEAAATFKPDVILMDIGLPKLNGYKACREIRGQPWSKNMVLVALTGWGQEEDRQKSRDAGFGGHLVKPVDHAALMTLLAELLPTPA